MKTDRRESRQRKLSNLQELNKIQVCSKTKLQTVNGAKLNGVAVVLNGTFTRVTK